MIPTTVPTSKLRPGIWGEFDITSKSRGLVPITRRALLVGGMLASGTATANLPVQVFAERDGDTLFGVGSELALMIRAALRAAAKAQLPPPQLWAAGVPDAGGSAAATYTLTVVVTTATAGDIILEVAGRFIRCGVAAGDAQNAIATNLKAAFDAAFQTNTMPCTAGVATNVVTLTAVNKGPVGADIRTPTVVKQPSGVTVTPAAGVAGTGAYAIATALGNALDKQYHGYAIGNHASADITAMKTHNDSVGAPTAKKWSIGHVAEYGSVATAVALAAAANYKDICVTAARDFPALPGEIAAQMVVTVESSTDPALSFDGVELDLAPPIAVSSIYSDAEIETLLAGGCTPVTLNDAQNQGKIERLVTTLITVNSATFYDLLDISNVRVLFYTAVQVIIALQIAFQRAKNTIRTQRRVKSVVYNTLKGEEDAEYVQNVDKHKDEIRVEQNAQVPTRLDLAVPVSPVPNLHQFDVVNTLFVELAV